MSKQGKQQGERKDFYCGAAAVLGTLARDHDQPSVAVDIMRSNGITLSDLQKAGADDFDLDYLRGEWKHANRKPRAPRGR